MENNTLNHAGIKGMRWGIRRFQNKDGSLTPLGKKRRRQETNGSDDKSAKAKETKAKPKTTKEMSDEELNKSIKRLELESRYNQLAAQTQTTSRGKRFVSDMIDKAVIPAVTEAGKSLLKDSLLKAGKKYLGLDVEESDMDKLKKEVDKLELEKRKTIAEDYFTKRQEKSEKGKDKSNKKSSESKDKSEKKSEDNKRDDDTETVTSEVFGEGISRRSSSSRTKSSRDTIIDADWTDVTVSNVKSEPTYSIGQSFVAALLEEPKK